jgi:hypothetical protein
MEPSLQHRLEQVRQRLCEAAKASQRDAGEVQLVAVSKRHPAAAVSEMAGLGQHHFGENYIDEAVSKIPQADPDHRLVWHFIGHLQSNKTRLAAEHFDWVQTVERLKIARRLHDQRPQPLPPLNVLIQVNVSDEASKSGCQLDQVEALAEQVVAMDRLCLRGLMAIPAALEDAQAQREQLKPLNDLFQRLQHRYPQMDTLSMGMTDDLEAAVAEGSTMLRIGTALFGPRPS